MPGALTPRQKPHKGRGMLVNGAPTPFLVRRCLLEELVPMLDRAFNKTQVIEDGAQPLDGQQHLKGQHQSPKET